MFNLSLLSSQSLFALLLPLLLNPSYAAVGTASYYGAPYLPTVCFGSDTSQFPAYGMFVAAGEGIWDNDASCGRQYAVRCLSSPVPRACLGDRIIQVKVVDRASTLNSNPIQKWDNHDPLCGRIPDDCYSVGRDDQHRVHSGLSRWRWSTTHFL